MSREEILQNILVIKKQMEDQYDLVNKAREQLEEYEYSYAKSESALNKILREEFGITDEEN